MSEFVVAARHRDGSKNLYLVSEVDSYEDARIHVKQAAKARVALVCIPGGKSLKEAPIPQEEPQEQTA